MCGIVGIAGDLFYKEEVTMQSLLLLDYFRGISATGLAAVRTNGAVHIAKLATDPITLFQMARFKEALNGNTSKLFLGHNRAPTSGINSNYNAHPYQFGHITGVQNGTLETRDKKALEELVGEEFEVDSQALFAAIAKVGIKEAIGVLNEGIDSHKGAWALVWHDQKEDTINFLRNQHRPMWLGWEEGYKRLFFASEWKTLEYACEFLPTPAYKFQRFERKDKPGEFYRFFKLPENQHIKFNLSDMMKGSKDRPKPVCKMIYGKEPIKSSGNKPTVWDPFPQRGVNAVGFHTPANSTTTSLSSTTRSGDRIIHLFGFDNEPYANVIGRQRFAELVQEGTTDGKIGQVGCSWCNKDIPFGTKGITVYEAQDVILCGPCSGQQPDVEPVAAARVFVDPRQFEILRKAA